MATLAALCQRGAFRPHVGATFPFNGIARAHALVETGHKRGNAVLLFGTPQ
jgi:NADPH:quinone reductase-like Zn-dependent oxidoreductase